MLISRTTCSTLREWKPWTNRLLSVCIFSISGFKKKRRLQIIKNPGKAGVLDISYTFWEFRQWYDEKLKKLTSRKPKYKWPKYYRVWFTGLLSNATLKG